LGLVEGYEAMSLQMAQPTLRAHMESELMQVSRGLKRGEDVVRDTMAEMQRVFHEVERNAATLDLALQEYLPAAGSGGESSSAVMLTPSFSRCGQCGGMCDLKKTASGNQQWSQRLLHCDSCRKSYVLPPKHSLQPHAHTCPICQFQVLQVNNEEKNTTWTLCPYCFNHPPQQEIEDTGQSFGSGFKCFQCTRADCVLANKSDHKYRLSVECRAVDVCEAQLTHLRFVLCCWPLLPFLQKPCSRPQRTRARLRCVWPDDDTQDLPQRR
jgi:DNA topoisomerase-3